MPEYHEHHYGRTIDANCLAPWWQSGTSQGWCNGWVDTRGKRWDKKAKRWVRITRRKQTT